jgi:16S rRNA G966 N2-methylase RsmD
MARLPVVLTCPAGFERVVAEVAERELSNFEVSQLDSGYISATTSAAVAQLRAFPCATNVFHVVATVPRRTLTADLQQLSRMLGTTTRPERLPRQGTFRLRIHDDGRFASHDSAPARQLEVDISDWSGLRPARGAARTEFWVLRRRRHADSLLASKLTAGNARVPAGVLRPEVCATLARIVPLDGASPVIDPFAGSGAVGIACLEAGAERVWLNDPNPAALHGVRALPQSLRERITATSLDFRDLDIDAASVSAIVTDPPWGHYDDLDTSVASLYADLANFAVEALVSGGPLVVLTGGGAAAVQSLTTRKELVLADSFPVLINGRKAQIVVATRA